MADNVIRTITIRGSSEGLDKLTADIKKLAAAEQGLAVVSDDLTKSQLSLEQQLKRQTLRLDEAARAQANIDREIRLSERGVKQKLKTDEEHARTVQLVNQRYGQATVGAGKLTNASAALTKQTSRNTAEMLNLGRQVADVGVSLQAGQSLLTVGIQQGAQIMDVFASSGRTAGEILSSAVGWAGRFAMSTTAIVTGIGAMAAGVLYLGNSFATAQRDIDKALAGMGGASGVTRGGINRIGEQATGLGMSVSQAREAATAFASTGKIYGENILTATKLTRDFALVTGVDATEATKTFAAALVDPSKGALELNKNLGFLDATTLNYIQSLQSQNKLQEAQKVMMEAMNPTIQKQLQYVGLLAKGWEGTKVAASNFFDDIGKGAARLGEVMSGLDFGGFSDEDRLRFAKQNQQTAQQRLTRETDPSASKALIQALTQAVREADAEVAKLQKRLEDVSATKRLAQLSLEAKAFSEAIIPGIEQVRNLEMAISRLQEAQAKGVAGPNAGAALTIAQATLGVTKETMEVEERKAARLLQAGSMHAQILAQMRDQLAVAGAVGVTAQIEAQHRATINQLMDQGKSLSQATAVADLERATALARIEAQHQVTMVSLRGELSVAQQITGLAQINAQYYANINNLLLQGLNLTQATAQAEMQRAIALAHVETAAKQQLRTLREEYEVIRASSEEEKGRIQARQEYNRLIDKGVSSETASNIAAQMQANARATQDAADNTKSWSVAADEANDAINRVTDSTYRAVDAAESLSERWAKITIASEVENRLDMLTSQFTSAGSHSLDYDPFGVKMAKNLSQQSRLLMGLPFIDDGNEGDMTKRFAELFKENTDATKQNTAATQTMTDVLSPFYSSDPRRTHLGFRSFAGGGIMTPYGELPLKQYQGGGVATSPQVAVYGEGSTPEAYVPVPSGRIPVEIRQPANSNQRPVNVTINVMGNADGNTVAALKSTAFQQAQTMRRAMG